MARRGKRRSYTDPFTDLVFNTLLGITFLLIVTMLFINPENKQGKINPKAEYIITVSWPDWSPDDIDTWVETPRGDLVWFRNPEAGLMNLDRDDRGMLNDFIMVNGEKLANPLNQEIVTIRGVIPGEYVVNVDYYATDDHKAVPVQVKVEKVNPVLEVIYYGEVTLDHQGEEKTMIRFKIAPDGSVLATNSLPKHLVKLQ
jgi:uncharacterized protein YfaP (DUF2135 family)